MLFQSLCDSFLFFSVSVNLFPLISCTCSLHLIQWTQASRVTVIFIFLNLCPLMSLHAMAGPCLHPTSKPNQWHSITTSHRPKKANLHRAKRGLFEKQLHCLQSVLILSPTLAAWLSDGNLKPISYCTNKAFLHSDSTNDDFHYWLICQFFFC